MTMVLLHKTNCRHW